jgi:prolyl-tRNA synthetase
MGARVLDENGKEHPIVMGSYGIGVERSMAALIDQYYREDRMSWPVQIAPFEAQVISLGANDVAQGIYDQLRNTDVDTAFDDRDMAPGAKFADADLIGIPFRIVVGPRGLKKGEVEIKKAASGETIPVSVEESARTAKQMIEAEIAASNRVPG